MGANYIFGRYILRGYKKKSDKNKYLFLSGITFNLLLLGYFKYANFFIDNIKWLSSIHDLVYHLLYKYAR